MKLRSLFWLVPIAALAAAYVARAPIHADGRNAPPVVGQVNDELLEPQPAAIVAVDDGVNAVENPIAAGGQRPPDCTIVTHYLRNNDGGTTEAYSCALKETRARHPYQSYSSAALESLAYADAKAAEILGMRLREEEEEAAMSLILRASALAGGDVEPILAFSNAYAHPTAINGVPVRKTIHVKFVLSAVADLLGAKRNNLPYWEDQIRRASSDPTREIAMLHKRARRILEEMRQIQLQVTGTSTFGGQSDA